ncbi:MAG: lipocalin family protein, partial [Deltaproteobacteria bacterium]
MFIFLPLLLTSCITMDMSNMKPLETVNFVDINRYIGEWYEIARYEHRFQEGCVGSKATYSLRDDGKITVVNECFGKSF